MTTDTTVGEAGPAGEVAGSPGLPQLSTAEVRTWARRTGLEVPDRGRLRPGIWDAWRAAPRST